MLPNANGRHTPLTVINERTQKLMLGRELGLLTDKQDEAIQLWADGYGYGWVARLLGVPRETARSRIQRGIVRVDLAARRTK